MENFIEVSGFKIFTNVWGTGKPLLLFHSLWGNLHIFDNLAQNLAQKYNVIRMDFPGHGKSSPPKSDYTFEEFALIINEVLNQLGIVDKINLIGHSMGGFAALAFAKKYEERIDSLILVQSLIREADAKSIRHRLRQADLINQNRKKLLLKLANESNFAEGNAVKFPDRFLQLEHISGIVTPEGALAGINAINKRQNSIPFLTRAKFPVMFVIGKKDKIYNSDEQLSECKLIPGAEVVLLNNSGHLSFIEEELLFTQSISTFLDSV